MKRWLASSVLVVTGAWLAAQPTGCAYDVPDLVSSSQTGTGGGGVGTGGTATTTSTASGMGGGGGGGSKPCDPDNSLCTGCPDTCDQVLGCAECNGDEDCQAPAVHCVAGRCLGCGDATHCLAGEVCGVVDSDDSLETACMPPCSDNADCDGSGPGADIRCRSGRCVECQEQSECEGDQVCDTVLGTCEQCVVDADCKDADRPFCGADRECHECNVDLQCPGNGVCIEHNCVIACCGDSDCTEGLLTRCNTATSECVECIDPSDCGVGLPYCTNGRCDECTTATEATDCMAPTPRCYGGTCSQCTPATEATDCPSGAPNCLGGSCVQCIFNSDCAAPTPYCGPANTCVQCTANLHCPSNTCVNNVCL